MLKRFWEPNFKDPFWNGFWGVFRHCVWLLPLAYVGGQFLREVPSICW